MLGELGTEQENSNEPRRHRRRESGSSLIAMTLVVALFGVLGVGGWWAYNNVIKEHFLAEDYEGEGNGTAVEVEVTEGMFVADIGNMLQEEGVVASAKAFTNASKDDGDSGTGIQVGTYALEEEMSGAAALAALLDPANRTNGGVNIPEGFTALQVYERLSEYTGVPVEDFEEAAKDPEALGVDPLWWEGFSDRQQKSVEGFLFPSTYEFDEKWTAEDMLKAMVAKFNAAIEESGFLDKIDQLESPDPGYDPASLQEQNFSPDTDGEFKIYPWMALQIASVIQKESGSPKDDSKIATVFYNRLYLYPFDRNELNCNCFQSEAIWNYGRVLNGEEPITSDQNINWGEEMGDPEDPWAASAPENAGYMPTPISNPGLASLEGAVTPADGTWLFFVTAFTEDGEDLALFADTWEEHQENTVTARENGF